MNKWCNHDDCVQFDCATCIAGNALKRRVAELEARDIEATKALENIRSAVDMNAIGNHGSFVQKLMTILDSTVIGCIGDKPGRPLRTMASVSTEQQKARKAVFLVTVMKPVDWESVPDKHMRRDRTWGWYASFEAAERDVLANATDMFECNYYSHAVIEEMPEGILSLAKVRGWYFANYAQKDEPVVARIDAPIWAEQIVNWGIG